ncbi:MAG: NAD-dependent epimerase/dehydratase family protein [Bacteroidota bacterium]
MKGKCLLLGGGGFIGSHLAEKLLKSGYSVRIFDIRNFSHKNIASFLDNLEIVEGDFHNSKDVRIALTDIDYVFHLVSFTIPSSSMINPLFDIETNLVSSVRFLEECILNKNIKSINFISSGGTIYGIPQIIPIPETHPSSPLNSYGIIKHTIENYCILYRKMYGLNCRIFRLSNPYGENQNPHGLQGVIPVFINKAISGEEIEIWGNGSVIRDYIYINDVTDVLTSSLEILSKEFIFNIGTGEGHSINDIVKIIRNIMKTDVHIRYQPSRNYDVPINILDISRAKLTFSWKPKMGIEEGIERMIKHLKLTQI